MSELVLARLVAAVCGLLGVSSIVIGGQAFSQGEITTALFVIGTAFGSLYAFVRTWRRGKLLPTSARAVDPAVPGTRPVTPIISAWRLPHDVDGERL